MPLEARTAALYPSNCGTGFAANGDTWMEAEPWAGSRSVSAIVVGAFCEHNDQVHSLLDLLAAKAGPGAETGTGLDTT
jgi:hypothetical protein